jgi:hypothetical protein
MSEVKCLFNYHEYLSQPMVDKHGHQIYLCAVCGIGYYKDNYAEYWRKYDKNGNQIYYKDSRGLEIEWFYDENGNRIGHRLI